MRRSTLEEVEDVKIMSTEQGGPDGLLLGDADSNRSGASQFCVLRQVNRHVPQPSQFSLLIGIWRCDNYFKTCAYQ